MPATLYGARYRRNEKGVYVTCTGESISGVSRQTGTSEAAHIVSAVGISATTSVVCCTLVDICVVANSPYMYSFVYKPWVRVCPTHVIKLSKIVYYHIAASG